MSRPNLLRTRIGKEDINEYIASADDFQLEIEVFRACLGARFDTEHGGSYKDPVTGLNRQFDVRARFQDGERFLKLAIECKALADFFPLVVSRVPRRSQEAQCHSLLSVPGSGGPRISLYLMRQGMFPTGEHVGKSTAQLGRKDQKDKPLYTGDAEIYEKWAQAIASAHDLIDESVHDYKKSGRKWASTLVLPVLVVADETLWAVDYDDTGSTTAEPKPVDECSIYLNTDVLGKGPNFQFSYPISHLLVYTKKGFSDFLERFTNHGMVRDHLLLDAHDLRQSVKAKFGDII